MLTDGRNLLFATMQRKWMFMWFGCWSKVIPTSHLPWGFVVEDETLHCQMSDHTVMYSENTNPHCWCSHLLEGCAMGTYNISYQYPTAIRKLLELQLKARFHKEKGTVSVHNYFIIQGNLGGTGLPLPPQYFTLETY